MQDALLLPFVDVYPRPGKEAADPLEDLAQSVKQLHVEAPSSFRKGPALWLLRKPASVSDYWQDGSLCLSGVANLDERITADEHSERSKREGNFTEDAATDKHEPSNNQEETFDEEASQNEDQQCEIKIRYDIFPPPIESPTRCERNSNFPSSLEHFHLQSIRTNGRFILRQRSMPTPHRYLRADREDGKLQIRLIEAKSVQEQWNSAATAELEEEQEVEEDGNLDERQVEEELADNVCDATNELGDYYCKEYANGYAQRNGDAIQQLTTRSGNRVASWVNSRAFLLNRVRPLVY